MAVIVETPSLTFEVAGLPVPQGSMRAFAHRTTGRVVTTHAGGKRLREWRGAVQLAAMVARRDAGWPYPPRAPGAYEVALTFRLPPRHGESGPHATTPDADRLARAALDAGTSAGLWRDDCEVARLRAEKFWDADAGLTMTVTRIA